MTNYLHRYYNSFFTGRDASRLTNGLTVFVVGVVLFVSVFSTLTGLVPSAGATGEQIVMGMPFNGKWAYNTPTTASCGTGPSQTAHPSCHGTSGTDLLGYDWATDYYAASTTPVKVTGTSLQGTVTFSSIDAGSQTCGSGLVITAKANGNSAGQIYVTHLDNSVVSSNLSSGDTIGTIHYQCFGVDHVHFSYKNTAGNHACYVNYSNQNYTAGMDVSYGASIGVLGSSNTGVQQVCSSIPSSQTANWGGNFSLTWATGRLDAFAPTTWSSGSANTDHVYYNGSWQPWDAPLSLGSQITSWPAAVSWGSGRIDVFARDTGGHLTQAYYTNADGWHNWNNSPFSTSCITGAPGVSSWGTNRLDVFAQGCGDNGTSLNHWWWDGTSWHTETLPISGQLLSAPAATSWGTNRIDVFAQGANGVLEQAYYDGTSWHGWDTTTFSGSCIVGAPGVSTWGINRLDIFAQQCNDSGNHVYHWYFNGSWQPKAALPNSVQITSSPSASSTIGVDRIDLFARDANGHLIQDYYDDAGGWHSWAQVPSSPTLGN